MTSNRTDNPNDSRQHPEAQHRPLGHSNLHLDIHRITDANAQFNTNQCTNRDNINAVCGTFPENKPTTTLQFYERSPPSDGIFSLPRPWRLTTLWRSPRRLLLHQSQPPQYVPRIALPTLLPRQREPNIQQPWRRNSQIQSQPTSAISPCPNSQQ
jgi:hypothetical protein